LLDFVPEFASTVGFTELKTGGQFHKGVRLGKGAPRNCKMPQVVAGVDSPLAFSNVSRNGSSSALKLIRQ